VSTRSFTRLTRRYRFSASHRLHSPELSDEANRELYGKCNNPFGHGHNYLAEISVTGTADPHSGLLVSVPALDALMERTVLRDLDHCDLNHALTNAVPTSENVAVEIERRLVAAWPADFPKLHGVRLWETKRNRFELTHEEQ
jgi:6-pyruvoyltetrahydropterin/6-carboxytetrahydropterin synthase